MQTETDHYSDTRLLDWLTKNPTRIWPIMVVRKDRPVCVEWTAPDNNQYPTLREAIRAGMDWEDKLFTSGH